MHNASESEPKVAQPVTPYHAKYFAWELARRRAASEEDRLSQSLFALNNPLSQGVILADEVGLGNTIEAALEKRLHRASRTRNLFTIRWAVA